MDFKFHLGAASSGVAKASVARTDSPPSPPSSYATGYVANVSLLKLSN